MTGSFEVVANLGGWGVGLCVDGDGCVHVCVIDKHKMVRADPATGKVEDYCTSVEGGPLPSPNYPAFGADGTLYVTDSRGPARRSAKAESSRFLPVAVTRPSCPANGSSTRTAWRCGRTGRCSSSIRSCSPGS